MYFVYVIKSNKTTYVGQTSNLEERLAYHNSNRSRFTKNKGPFKIIYSEEFNTRSEAVKREKLLKSGQGRECLKTRITNGM